jgi:hypothetical protein
MDKLEIAIENIRNCDICHGQGNLYWGTEEDFDFETCECNPNELILDDDGAVIWDNGMLDEPGIFDSEENE